MRLINISNHPSTGWSEEQKKGWDDIIDIPFPQVSPSATAEEVASAATFFYKNIIEDLYRSYREEVHSGKVASAPHRNAVLRKKLLSKVMFHLAGEYCFFYSLATAIIADGGKIVTACSERQVTEKTNKEGQTEKKVIFQFVQWRNIKA